MSESAVGVAYCSELRPAAGLEHLFDMAHDWTLKRLGAVVFIGLDDTVKLVIFDEGNFKGKFVDATSK